MQRRALQAGSEPCTFHCVTLQLHPLITLSGPASPLKVLIPDEYTTTTSNCSGGTAADLSSRIRSTAPVLSVPASPLRFSPSAASPSVANQLSPDRWLNHVCCGDILQLIFETTHLGLQSTAFMIPQTPCRICLVHPACRRTVLKHLAAYEIAGLMLSGARHLV